MIDETQDLRPPQSASVAATGERMGERVDADACLRGHLPDLAWSDPTARGTHCVDDTEAHPLMCRRHVGP